MAEPSTDNTVPARKLAEQRDSPTLSDDLRLFASSIRGHGTELLRTDTPWRAGLVSVIEKAACAIETLKEERATYKTLAQIGTWHPDCRPNRAMAARELEKSQAVINKLADTISELRAEIEGVENVKTILKAVLISWDADQDCEFDDALRAAREFMGFTLAERTDGPRG